MMFDLSCMSLCSKLNNHFRMSNHRYAMFNERFASRYRKLTLGMFLLTTALYKYLSKTSLSYNMCDTFTMDEEQIQYPDVKVESIPTKMLFKITFGSILTFLFVVECSSNSLSLHGLVASIRSVWQYFKYILAGMYWAGILLWIVKLRVGRLRPCFIDGCQIADLDVVIKSTTLDVTMCKNEGYHYYCQSFFSGHAMLAFYSFMSLAGYVYHRKIRWSRLFYGILISVPSWIGYTRILDNQHHPSDVVVGAGVGSAFALFTFLLVDN